MAPPPTRVWAPGLHPHQLGLFSLNWPLSHNCELASSHKLTCYASLIDTSATLPTHDPVRAHEPTSCLHMAPSLATPPFKCPKLKSPHHFTCSLRRSVRCFSQLSTFSRASHITSLPPARPPFPFMSPSPYLHPPTWPFHACPLPLAFHAPPSLSCLLLSPTLPADDPQDVPRAPPPCALRGRLANVPRSQRDRPHLLRRVLHLQPDLGQGADGPWVFSVFQFLSFGALYLMGFLMGQGADGPWVFLVFRFLSFGTLYFMGCFMGR